MDQEVISAPETSGSSPEAIMARNTLSRMMSRRGKVGLVPPIKDVKYIEDGNLTVVVVKTDDNEVIGWAKFNPYDVKTLKQTSKRQKTYTKIETKFNAKAGREKALHRALEKML